MKKRSIKISVGKEIVVMEERKCRGCKATFKIKKGSPQLYHNFDCQAVHLGIEPGFSFFFGVEVAPTLPKSGKFEIDDED